MKKLLSLTLVLSSLTAFSWGLTGHRIIGHIAMDHLNPDVRAHILETLGGENLAQVANWMDFIKSDHAYDSLKPYHYCTITNADAVDGHVHPEGGDVWEGIEKFLREIETGKFSVNEAFALKTLAHLIGDVHQPLHCGNGTDMGGNKIKVTFFWESSNLHRVWDSGMIDYWSMSYTEYSVWVMSTRVAADIESWKNSTVKDWVKESVILRDQCYAFDDPEKLGYRYIYDHSDLLHLRLAQGGVRLADALNKAYAKRG